eukprot:122893-Prorocentrum_minimum.AAC.5
MCGFINSLRSEEACRVTAEDPAVAEVAVETKERRGEDAEVAPARKGEGGTQVGEYDGDGEAREHKNSPARQGRVFFFSPSSYFSRDCTRQCKCRCKTRKVHRVIPQASACLDLVTAVNRKNPRSTYIRIDSKIAKAGGGGENRTPGRGGPQQGTLRVECTKPTHSPDIFT